MTHCTHVITCQHYHQDQSRTLHTATTVTSWPPYLDPITFLDRLHQTHTYTQLTRRYLQKLGRNRILGRKPPLISENEKQMSRVHLTGLCCGHHPYLNSYKKRLNSIHTTSCPNCRAPHTVKHILEECPAWYD